MSPNQSSFSKAYATVREDLSLGVTQAATERSQVHGRATMEPLIGPEKSVSPIAHMSCHRN